MSKVVLKVGKSGKKIAESKNKVVLAQANGHPEGKPVYRTKAKMTAHITINGKRRK